MSAQPKFHAVDSGWRLRQESAGLVDDDARTGFPKYFRFGIRTWRDRHRSNPAANQRVNEIAREKFAPWVVVQPSRPQFTRARAAHHNPKTQPRLIDSL